MVLDYYNFKADLLQLLLFDRKSLFRQIEINKITKFDFNTMTAAMKNN